MRRSPPAVYSVAAALFLGAGPVAAECRPTELPRALFGDLHVHTAYSNDAFGMGTRALPDDAYRFAQGAAIVVNDQVRIQPGQGLDFAAVTDHAEQLAAATICADPEHANYKALSCRIERKVPRLGIILAQLAGPVFGADSFHCANGACVKAGDSAWSATMTATEQHNQPCRFSTFHAYEWSGLSGDGGNIHRNVIFNQQPTIRQPFSAFTHTTPAALWRALRASCTDTDSGCDAITIPHNSNLSLGRMFPAYADATYDEQELRDRAQFDRLAEIIQHKGSSECYYTPGVADESCAFEFLPYSSFMGKILPALATPPANDSSFLRNAGNEGLLFQKNKNTNPYRLGFIGSTDTHTATPGNVSEQNYREHHNRFLSLPGSDLQIPSPAELNPGGLAVLYARSNSRAELFAAMQRREVYATSGHRLNVRFFAGDAIAEDLCSSSDAIAEAYSHGAAMGAELISASAPRFFVSALKAPDTAGRVFPGIQRLEIVKGWVDDAGRPQEKVTEVISAPLHAPTDCEKPAMVPANLCATWVDPAFNPNQYAHYYARVIEQPTCRWSQIACQRLQSYCAGNDCEDIDQKVCESTIPSHIRERAWTSPIWFSPSR